MCAGHPDGCGWVYSPDRSRSSVPNNWPSALLTYPGLGNLPTSVSNLLCLPRELQLSLPPPTKMCALVTMSSRVGAWGCWGVPLFLSSLAIEFPRQKLGYI